MVCVYASTAKAAGEHDSDHLKEVTSMSTKLRQIPRELAIGLLGSIGSPSLFGCKGEAGSSLPSPVPQVHVVDIIPQTVPDEPEFIGQAEASRPVEIRSQVTGIIKQRYFAEGRDVKKGDLLYQIDPVHSHAAVVSAKGRVAQAEARLVQAKQNLARLKPLLSEQAVSQKDVDDAIAEDVAARAALEAAKGDLVKARFDEVICNWLQRSSPSYRP
jgi:membrane fusion protein (multidrug efflux system)